jgi:pyridoxine/pyridoxamine 5'-phosphate oxidase
MIETDLYTFIAGCKYGVLGTIGDSGAPQSALVGIGVTEKLEIVFDTVKSSRKYRNLIARPDCSFSIGWVGEKTVQYEGVAEELTGGVDGHQKNYFNAYFKAWPDGPARLSWPGIAHFVVRPKWIRYSDYDQRPPLIQEFRFDS